MRLGVPRGGACDPAGLAVANLLIGNPIDAPALEITLAGPVLDIAAPMVIAIGGTDLGCHVVDEGRPIPAGSSSLVRAGSTIAFTGGEGGTRAYLAVPGGLDVPRVLGSASTSLAGGFAGLAGRRVRNGDRLTAAAASDVSLAGRRWVAPQPSSGERPLRVVAGPQARALRHVEAVLLETEWRVEAGDRIGLRLSADGPAPAALAAAVSGLSEARSVPMVWGAVQVPPSGEPICLLPDHGTVGGYAVPFVVATVDRGRLGQLRAGDPVRFELVTAAAARDALRAENDTMQRVAAALATRTAWDDLPDAAV
jgi:antagonist of KipI